MEGVSAKGTALWMTLMELCSKTGCHQRPDRSFFLFGCQMPLCARCTGLVAGQIVGALISVFTAVSPAVSSSLLLPMAADGLLQLGGIKESTNRRRLITGLLGGIGIALLYGYLLRTAVRAFKKLPI